MGLFVGTIVTLSLYMPSNSALSVAAVPVMPQSFGNYIDNCSQTSETQAIRKERHPPKVYKLDYMSKLHKKMTQPGERSFGS